MPSSIPYDHPSLVLGNIIHPLLLGKLKQISALQTKIDASQDKMNSHIAMKRSIGMTINEMLNMNVDASALLDKMMDIDAAIVKAATDYAAVRLTNETSILEIKEQISEMEMDDNAESPINFDRTALKKMPLSSDSLKLDAQYFSYDENNEDNPLETVASIENYIKESTNTLGRKASSDVANAASAQINQQRKNHSLSGTLVITASCTHKNAVLMTPCIIDVDKAIAIWNNIYPGNHINTANAESVKNTADVDDSKSSDGISLISGATYGSSFVGMLHLLKQDLTGSNSQPMASIAGSLQERLTIGNWLEESSGGFGVDPAVAEDIKNLLSTQKITSHITIVVMGSIPSIKSNQLKMGVRAFSDFKPEQATASLASLSNATSSEKKTIDQAADTAKTGAKMLAMQGANIQSVMLGLGKIDQGDNKVMDINSLMVAFEDYIDEIRKGDAGVPVNFYIKKISQKQLAQAWLEKYYPSKDLTSTASINKDGSNS